MFQQSLQVDENTISLSKLAGELKVLVERFRV